MIINSELQLKARIFNTATPAADANLLTTDITNTITNSALLNIYCCFSAAGVLSVLRTVAGATVTELLNSGNVLSAGCTYDFTISCQKDTTLNFRYSAGSGTTLIFVIDELTS